jgi:hypothetical protein
MVTTVSRKPMAVCAVSAEPRVDHLGERGREDTGVCDDRGTPHEKKHDEDARWSGEEER